MAMVYNVDLQLETGKRNSDLLWSKVNGLHFSSLFDHSSYTDDRAYHTLSGWKTRKV